MPNKKRLLALGASSVMWLNRYKFHAIPLLLLAAWLSPYILGGTKTEWGDFGVFTQGYEAIRITVLQYHQFPWFDPWLAGGVPLYANPQIGVFSIQTLLVLLFGAPIGLKISVIIYTLFGYASMYVLSRKYFKITPLISSLLSLIWIFSSFFVSHLPSHYTFVWFMMAPGFVYLALTLRSIRSGVLFGLAFAVMGLSEIHYSFFQIAIICGFILLARLIIDSKNRLLILRAMLLAGCLFIILTGHRVLLTIENVNDFPRTMEALYDPAAGFTVSILSLVLPFSTAHATTLAHYIHYPKPHYGFGEQTASIGIFASLAGVTSLIYYLRSTITKKLAKNIRFIAVLVVIAGIFFFLMGLGAFSPLAPYSLLRHLPIFNNTRVSARWFLWFTLCVLIFIGYIATHAPRKSYYRQSIVTLLVLGVAELFALNIGYQNQILKHPVITAPKPASNYTFEQVSALGQSLALPGNKGSIPNDGSLPHFYREYEATTYNLGTLQANDSFVDLNTNPTPRCSYTQGCHYVLTSNAKITYWSPDKVVLHRTGPGVIKINANNSNYYVVNGVRSSLIRVAEPFIDFDINLPDSTKVITIETKPTISKHRLHVIVSGSLKRN